MIRNIPDAGDDDTVTHTLPPTALIRLIHRPNRVKFGQIFGTDRAALKKFWQSLLSSDDGTEFQALHPDLKDKTPEDLETSMPIIIHEDAAPYSKRRGVNVLQWGPLMVKWQRHRITVCLLQIHCQRQNTTGCNSPTGLG